MKQKGRVPIKNSAFRPRSDPRRSSLPDFPPSFHFAILSPDHQHSKTQRHDSSINLRNGLIKSSSEASCRDACFETVSSDSSSSSNAGGLNEGREELTFELGRVAWVGSNPPPGGFYDEFRHPEGVINLTTAENGLMKDELLEVRGLSSAFLLSSFPLPLLELISFSSLSLPLLFRRLIDHSSSTTPPPLSSPLSISSTETPSSLRPFLISTISSSSTPTIGTIPRRL